MTPAASAMVLPFPRPIRAVPPVQLSLPEMTGAEATEFARMLASGWVAPAGPVLARFEHAVGIATGFAHAAAVASGTAAIGLACRLVGVTRGDAVWTSTLTFVASIAPAVHLGARPVFLDVDPGSWTLHPGLLSDALARAARRGRLPRAIIAVDLYGQPADLPAIVAAGARWGVPVIADCAESLGASAHDTGAGRGALLACFSFNGNKIVTCGGGGALASDDAALIARARFLATQAKDPAPHYQHSELGETCALPAPCAAVGLAQLPALERRVAQRRARFATYARGLADLPGVAPMPQPAWALSSRWLSAFTFADPDRVRAALAARGIESRPVWKPMHLQPVFRGAGRVGGAIAAGLFAAGLCLPSGRMPEGAQARVIAAVRSACT